MCGTGVWHLRCRGLHADLADLQPEQLRLGQRDAASARKSPCPAADVEQPSRPALAAEQIDREPPSICLRGIALIGFGEGVPMAIQVVAVSRDAVRHVSSSSSGPNHVRVEHALQPRMSSEDGRQREAHEDQRDRHRDSRVAKRNHIAVKARPRGSAIPLRSSPARFPRPPATGASQPPPRPWQAPGTPRGGPAE